MGYKGPFRTSQETHYSTVTESSRLMLCTIWGFHGGDHEECRLLGCYAVWLLQEPTILRNARLHYQGEENWRVRNNVSSKQQPKHAAKRCFSCWLLLTLFLARRFLSLWWWRRYRPNKVQLLLEPHDVTSQKTAFSVWITHRVMKYIAWSCWNSPRDWNVGPSSFLDKNHYKAVFAELRLELHIKNSPIN
jgi:hypothetical protein